MNQELKNVRLSGGCINLLGDIGSAVYETALKKAVEHAAVYNRDLVEEDDIRAALREALEDVANHVQGSHAGQENIHCGK